MSHAMFTALTQQCTRIGTWACHLILQLGLYIHYTQAYMHCVGLNIIEAEPSQLKVTWHALGSSVNTGEQWSGAGRYIDETCSYLSLAIEWWHLQRPWRTHSPDSRSLHFWSRISRKRCILWTYLGVLWNKNRKPHPVHRVVPHSMTLTDPWSGFQGRDICDINYLRNDTT